MIKRLILAASLLLASPAHAWQVLPYTFAKTFCEMRRLGMSQDDATQMAARHAAIDAPNAPMVTLAGHKVRSDALMAVKLINEDCPELAR